MVPSRVTTPMPILLAEPSNPKAMRFFMAQEWWRLLQLKRKRNSRIENGRIRADS